MILESEEPLPSCSKSPSLPAHHKIKYADGHSAMEGADVFVHYHPKEEKDAQDVKKAISEKAPKAKVELYAADLQTEEENLKMVEAIKKWSNNELHVL